MSQNDPSHAHPPPSHFSKIHFHIILPSEFRYSAIKIENVRFLNQISYSASLILPRWITSVFKIRFFCELSPRILVDRHKQCFQTMTLRTRLWNEPAKATSMQECRAGTWWWHTMSSTSYISPQCWKMCTLPIQTLKIHPATNDAVATKTLLKRTDNVRITLH